MSSQVEVSATGRKSRDSGDSEVFILAYCSPTEQRLIDLERLELGDDWELRRSFRVGAYDAPIGLVSRQGRLELPPLGGGKLALVSHPWSGVVEIRTDRRTHTIDLYSEQTRVTFVDVNTGDLRHGDVQEVIIWYASARPVTAKADEQRPPALGLSERGNDATYDYRLTAAIDPVQPVALYVPRWHGVAASTRNHFAQTIPIPRLDTDHPSDITPRDIEFYARFLAETGCRHFVISGGDVFWIEIVRAAQAFDSAIRFDLLWHSNFLQMGEEHDWNLLRHWLRAIDDGLITRVGVVKRGLENFFAKLGIDCIFVPNIIRTDPREIRYNGGIPKVGIWLSGSSSYRKLPHASIIAVKLMSEYLLTGAGFDPAVMELVAELGIRYDRLWPNPLPQEVLHRHMKDTGLTLYVTLSECSPMLPLESLHLGIPCLIGPSSHLFRDHDYLRRTLVVDEALSPVAICEKALAARAEGERIIEAYREYALEEQSLERAAISRLLA